MAIEAEIVGDDTPRCRTCRFWSGDRRDGQYADAAPCRRHAPAGEQRPAVKYTYADGSESWSQRDAVWPKTSPNEFCGEHQELSDGHR